eukprot:scaffold3576_cov170-Amphora_coffeaeformis.AAC.26
MMIVKSWALLCFAAVSVVAGFSPSQVSVRTVSTALSMGWFDIKKAGSKKTAAVKEPEKKKKKSDDWIKNMFSPVHGGGSANEHDLDSMYAAQQALLADRRKNFDQKSLKSKYKKVGQDHLRDIPTIAHDPKLLNKKEDDVSGDSSGRKP